VSDRKEIAGPILAFVGGLVILIYGVVEIYLAVVVATVTSLNGLPVVDVGGVLVAGVLGIVFGLLIMAFALATASYSEYSTGFGVLIILFSLCSLVSVGGGNGVGFLLAVLGGTSCIVFAPEDPIWALSSSRASAGTSADALPPAPPPSSADAFGRTLRGCPRCGEINPIANDVCSGCGQSLRSEPR